MQIIAYSTLLISRVLNISPLISREIFKVRFDVYIESYLEYLQCLVTNFSNAMNFSSPDFL